MTTFFVCRRGGSNLNLPVKKYKCVACGQKFEGEKAYKEHECPKRKGMPK